MTEFGQPKRTSRRYALVATVGTAVTVLAGCLGEDDGEDDPEVSDDTEATDDTDDDAEVGDDEVETLNPPIKGDPDAAVTVEVYEDFGCPGCAVYHQNVLPEVEQAYTDDETIRYEHRDLPIPAAGDTSWEAANAARAVQDQAGDDAFWEYVGLLYENQAQLTTDLFGTLAEEVGVDGEAVRTAATEQQYDETVQSDRQRGVEMDVSGTPTVVVDGEIVDWSEIQFDPVEAAIDSALE